ncbi:hypothetical protein H8959_012038 [Pygathrix nigripes]
MKEEDVLNFLAAGTHLGGTNLDLQMEQYMYKRESDGTYILTLKRTWEKLLLAARGIVATENPADVSVMSSRNTGQRAVLKFAAATGATPIAGRFTPGTFTNQIQAAFREPRLMFIHPRADRQPLIEASYVNLPTLLCVTRMLLCAMWTLLSQATTRELTRDPEEIEKEEQAAAEKAVTRRNFRVNGLLQLLSSLLLILRLQTGLKMCTCPL